MTSIDQIIAIAREIAPDADARPESTFDDLAFDSLSCIDFTVSVEDRFDVAIGCGDRVSFETLADVARLVDARLAARLPLAA